MADDTVGGIESRGPESAETLAQRATGMMQENAQALAQGVPAVDLPLEGPEVPSIRDVQAEYSAHLGRKVFRFEDEQLVQALRYLCDHRDLVLGQPAREAGIDAETILGMRMTKLVTEYYTDDNLELPRTRLTMFGRFVLDAIDEKMRVVPLDLQIGHVPQDESEGRPDDTQTA